MHNAQAKKPEFLVERLDANGRQKSDPDFDSSTLLITDE
jgi:hypothetical protein